MNNSIMMDMVIERLVHSLGELVMVKRSQRPDVLTLSTIYILRRLAEDILEESCKVQRGDYD